MKHIVQFSGGAASAYVAILLSKEVDTKDMILLNHDTGAEHPDTKRFMKDISEYINVEITQSNADMNLWGCIIKNRCLPAWDKGFCTRELKLIPAEAFYKTFNCEITVYNGFTLEEWRRVQKSTSRGQISLLYNRKISSDDAKYALLNMGFELPITYKYLQHNNCIPCFKAGKRHFRAVWEYFPCEFAKAVEMEKKISLIHHKPCTVFKGISLSELAEKWQHEKETGVQGLLEDDQNDIPCACWDL